MSLRICLSDGLLQGLQKLSISESQTVIIWSLKAQTAAGSVPFPQSQEEVVTMKFCSTCKEEFADKFSFCPVDGTPLNRRWSRRVGSASDHAPKFSEPVMTSAAIAETAPPMTRSAPVMAGRSAAGGRWR